jgi:radical SAM superfamily enzyme YgiQ (UPF0313 family)
MPPLGLLYVASYLEEQGVSVDIIDPFSDGKEYKSDSSYVGITCMSNQWEITKEIAKSIKADNPNAVVIVGGVHPTVSESIYDPNIDVIVRGEGEKAMLKIVKENVTKGIVQGEPIENLDDRPFPARHLINMKKYTARADIVMFNWISATTVITSLGCPNNCIFCINSKRAMFGRKVRYNSPSYVEKEVEQLVSDYKIEGVHFPDDNFLSWKKRAIEICQKIKRFDLIWDCESRVDNLDRELILQMKSAGCDSVGFGIESGSPKVLRALNKRAEIEQAIKAFDLCHENKIKTLAQIIIGSPEETLEDIALTEKLLDRIKPDYVQLSYMTPYEGTVIYDMAVEKGWIRKTNMLAGEPQVEINFGFAELEEIGNGLIRKYNPFFRKIRPYLSKYFVYDMLRLLGKKPSLLFNGTRVWNDAAGEYL